MATDPVDPKLHSPSITMEEGQKENSEASSVKQFNDQTASAPTSSATKRPSTIYGLPDSPSDASQAATPRIDGGSKRSKDTSYLTGTALRRLEESFMTTKTRGQTSDHSRTHRRSGSAMSIPAFGLSSFLPSPPPLASNSFGMDEAFPPAEPPTSVQATGGPFSSYASPPLVHTPPTAVHDPTVTLDDPLAAPVTHSNQNGIDQGLLKCIDWSLRANAIGSVDETRAVAALATMSPKVPSIHRSLAATKVAGLALNRPKKAPVTARPKLGSDKDDAGPKHVLDETDNTMARYPHMFVDIPLSSSPCKCKNTKCLKLYCACFQGGIVCNPHLCRCQTCLNTADESGRTGARVQAITIILRRRPDAFQQRRHKKTGEGCACKKNRCLRKYCDCIAVGTLCSDRCTCVGCMNNASAVSKAPSGPVASVEQSPSKAN